MANDIFNQLAEKYPFITLCVYASTEYVGIIQNQPWDQVFRSVWDGDSSRGFMFKQSHAISYADLVALHMNLLNTPDQSN